MYKTIRHGENSLQYTILPQNDDFRIEGKLSSAESSCSSTSGSASARKSKGIRAARRRSFFAYLGLIFVCTVIVGAILIPFLVSAECLPNPSEWFLKTKAALTRHGSTLGATTTNTDSNHSSEGEKIHGETMDNGDNSPNGELAKGLDKLGNRSRTDNISNAPQAYHEMSNSSNIFYNDTFKSNASAATSTETISSQTQNRVISYEHPSASQLNEVKEFDPENSDIADKNSTSSRNNNPTSSSAASAPSALPPQLTAILAANMTATLAHSDDTPLTTKPISLPTIRPTSSLTAANINSPRLVATKNMGSNQVFATPLLPTLMTRIIQVPLLKSSAKKPVIAPMLAKTNSQLTAAHSNEGRFEDVPTLDPAISSSVIRRPSPYETSNPSNSDSNWIHTHWPYIDPSTYFQWTGYKSEDSVLLPALLGFALIGMILIIAICFVARNKRRIVSSVRKRNRNDIEETGADDNATLLTSTNLSDED